MTVGALSFQPGGRGQRRFGPALWCAILIGALQTGCAEYRMSLTDFLQIQQQAREAAAESFSMDEMRAVRELLDRRLGPYKVGPSDVLSVALTPFDGLVLFTQVQVRVDRNGEIDLPLVGALRVDGAELEDVEDVIHDAYVPGVVKDAVVHVELVAPHYTSPMVIGAVSSPGLVPLRRTERNLLYAIVGAGGASDLASGKVTLRRIRQPAAEITLDLTDPKELRAALALEPLEDGDIVTVHAATPNTVFVGGLVNMPRPQPYPAGVQVSVLQALAAAGGLRTDISPREGTLVRRMPDGTDVHVKLELDRIGDGRDPDILLAAGDILWVPHTFETRIQDFISRNIFLRAGVSVNYSVTGIEFLNRRRLQTRRLGFGGGVENNFDPFGFLTRGSALQTITAQPPPLP